VFIVLGRYGDLIQMLPCFWAIYERTGFKPIIIVSTEYASVLEGVSYVQMYPIQEHWYMGVPKARQIAEETFGGGILPHWWHDDPALVRSMEGAANGGLVLQCHGHNWGVDIARWPSYGASMAERCGFTLDEWLSLPLVFDRRSKTREDELAAAVIRDKRRPLLLYNFEGVSSPFPFKPEVLNAILQHFAKDFVLLDLGKVRGKRIYDLLGLYDRAVGLITTDTATLHLAPAAAIPYVAFTVDGWTTSIPKGNCQLQIPYHDSVRLLPEVVRIVGGWKTPHDNPRHQPVPVH
jgi:hypothetical protein